MFTQQSTFRKTPRDAARLFKYVHIYNTIYAFQPQEWLSAVLRLGVSQIVTVCSSGLSKLFYELVMSANLQPTKLCPSNQPFLAKYKSNNFSDPKTKSATHLIRNRHANLTHTSTNMTISTVKNNTRGSNAPNSLQMKNSTLRSAISGKVGIS